MHDPCRVTVVYMGDSITAGQYVEPELRWTEIISARLTRKYLNTAVNLLMFTRGVSGETTRQGLERFPADVQSAAPDVMTLQYGLNDCNCWVTDRGLPRVSEPAYRANLVEMVERARSFGARRVILSTNHPTLRHKVLMCGESLETRRMRYNAIVRDVAEQTGATLCDIEQAFAQFVGSSLEEMVMPYPDHLHLSRPGHAHYVDSIYALIESSVSEAIADKQES